MLKYRYLRNNLERTCRTCLNQIYKVKLKPKDCVYDDYPHVCSRCKEMKNIVSDIKTLKKLFL